MKGMLAVDVGNMGASGQQQRMVAAAAAQEQLFRAMKQGQPL